MRTIGSSEMINVTAEFGGMDLRKFRFGAFAGTLIRLVARQNGEVPGFGYI
jgi:hypothetical protein